MISWARHMSGRENTSVAAPGRVVDIAPTLLALAHVRGQDAGKPAMDGISLAGALEGHSVTRAQPLFFEHEGSRAIIDVRWKLAARAPGPRTPMFRPWELYDVSGDRAEARDLAGTHRDEVARLAAQRGPVGPGGRRPPASRTGKARAVRLAPAPILTQECSDDRKRAA